MPQAPAAKKSVRRGSAAAKKAAATPAKKAPPRLRIAIPGEDDRAAPTSHPSLTPVPDQPGVFINQAGLRVNAQGVMLRLADAQTSEASMDEAILGGPVDSPAKLLKRVALDPRMPMAWRLDAAKAAAPYFDRKTPVAVENTNMDLTLDVEAIRALPREKRVALLKMLRDLGVDINVPDA